MSHRPKKLAGVIQKELTALLQRGKLKDPRVHSLTTFTAVEVAGDLSHATVYFTVMGQDEAGCEETKRGLAAAKAFLTRHLAKVLSLRTVPQLHFSHDGSFEQGDKISRLLLTLPELHQDQENSSEEAESLAQADGDSKE